jgi:hypothetical protein
MSEQQGAPGSPPAPPANATEANARLTALGADKAWYERFTNGDQGTLQEFQQLTTMIADNVDKVAVAMSGQLPPGANGEIRELAGTAEMLKNLGIRSEVIRETLSSSEVSQEEHDKTRIWLDQQIANREFSKKLADGDPETRQKFMLANIILSSEIKGVQGRF